MIHTLTLTSDKDQTSTETDRSNALARRGRRRQSEDPGRGGFRSKRFRRGDGEKKDSSLPLGVEDATLSSA